MAAGASSFTTRQFISAIGELFLTFFSNSWSTCCKELVELGEEDIIGMATHHKTTPKGTALLCSSPLAKALQEFWQIGKLPDGQKETQRDE